MKHLIISVLALILAAASLPAQNNPGLSYATVLNSINLITEIGALRVSPNDLRGTFMQPGGKGEIIVKEVTGREIQKFNFEAQLVTQPYFMLNIMNFDDMKPGPGDYIAEFYYDGKPIYRFPFKITKLASDNPFEGTDKLFLEGDWENWGYFLYPGANPEQNLMWKIWLRNKATRREKEVKIDIRVTSDQDGKVICTNRYENNYTLNDRWVRYEFDMIFPPEKQGYGSYFKAKDLLNKDGNYTLTMKIDNNLYGKWKFSVKDGRFVLSGRALRGKADPLTFIEGGLDAFWYEKAKN